jgi:hypothetical protein
MKSVYCLACVLLGAVTLAAIHAALKSPTLGATSPHGETKVIEDVVPADRAPSHDPGKFSALVAKESTWTFTIQASKLSGDKFYFNDMRDYRAPGCRTIAVDLTKGKTIRAKGSLTDRGLLVTRLEDVDID